jgi:hypothetical protein
MADIIMRNIVETPVFIDKVSEKIKLLENVNKNLHWNFIGTKFSTRNY